MVAAAAVAGSYQTFPLGLQTAGKGYEQKTQYSGTELDLGLPLQCTSEHAAAAGVWRTGWGEGEFEIGSYLNKQRSVTTWRITLKGSTADVARFSGATQTLEKPKAFNVETTLTGVLLTAKRAAGESSEIITIDPGNSS